MSTASIPTNGTVYCLFLSTLLEFVCLIFNIVSVILCLIVEKMYLFQRESTTGNTIKYEITCYIQVIACISLAVNALALMFSLINSIIGYRSLWLLRNRIDRQKIGAVQFKEELPPKLVVSMKNFYTSI